MKTTKLREEFSILDIGQRIKSLRRKKNYSLNDLSRMTGISEATLSRVENNQTLVSAHNLYLLSRILDVDITTFFELHARPISGGIRSICRKDEGVLFDHDGYRMRFLCSDLSNKKMHPAVVSVTRTEINADREFARYEGGEYVYVLDGNLTILSEFYEPLHLAQGDSVYFDSNMGHAYVSTDGQPVKILLLSTANIQQTLQEPTEKTHKKQ